VPERRRKRLTLIACILGSAIVFVDQTVVNVALPDLRDDLDASLADQQWVVEAYLLTLASLILVGGSLGDLHGRRRVFAVGVAGFGATSLLCAIAPTVEVLIAARGLQGIFGALLVPSSLAIITDVFETDEERGAAIGSWTAATSACIAVGPVLGGVLVEPAGWRMIFALNLPLVAACLVLIARAVPASAGEAADGRRIDVPGALLCALGLAGPVFALIRQQTLGWQDPEVLAALGLGLAAIAAFVARERRAPDPMLPLGVFASRNFAVGNLVTLGMYAGLTAATFYVALFLQQVAGYTPVQAGFALFPVTVIMVSMSRRFGALAARIGPRPFMGGGPLIAGCGLLLYLRLDADVRWSTDILPATLVFGLGLSMTVAPLTATVLAAADRRHAGIASGINNAVARVAGLLAIAVVGAVISAQFSSRLDDRLPAGEQTEQSRRFTGEARRHPLVLPDTPVAPAVRARAQDANVEAFRTGILLAGLLVMAGGVVALAGLREPPRDRSEAVVDAAQPAGT
jgi:EmrB/QacA subfamily drug resistance transporter